MQEDQHSSEPSWQFNPDDSTGSPHASVTTSRAQTNAQPASQPARQVSEEEVEQAMADQDYGPEDFAEDELGPHDDEATVTWTASEYLSHEKGLIWYLVLGAGGALISLIIYFFSRDLISAAVPAVAALTLGIFAARKPQVLHYAVDDRGIRIGDKMYPYEHFKSFTILQEGMFLSVELLPIKRFSVPIMIYFDPRDADRIIDVLAQFLPHDQRQVSIIDQIMQQVRF